MFLSSWRLQSAATRDHSLAPPPYHLMQQQRSRTTSDASSKQQIAAATVWHREICEFMLFEYKQYLQVLGFNPLQIESQHKSKELVCTVIFLLPSSIIVLLFFKIF